MSLCLWGCRCVVSREEEDEENEAAAAPLYYLVLVYGIPISTKVRLPAGLRPSGRGMYISLSKTVGRRVRLPACAVRLGTSAAPCQTRRAPPMSI